MSEKLPIEEREDSIRIHIRVQPRASQNKLFRRGNRLCVSLTSPPVDGKANLALCKYMAGVLSIAKSQVELHSGERSRDKTVAVGGMTYAEVCGAIERSI